jgi:hypothetical protein
MALHPWQWSDPPAFLILDFAGIIAQSVRKHRYVGDIIDETASIASHNIRLGVNFWPVITRIKKWGVGLLRYDINKF